MTAFNLLGRVEIHLPAVLIVGLAIFFGTVGGRIFQRLRIPQVLGYIVIGVIIGRMCLGIIGPETIERMRSFNYFALGIIGFLIGGELKLDVFRRYGKQFLIILLAEGLMSFALVAAVVLTVCRTMNALGWLEQSFAVSLALSLLLGAIATATDPASTVSVIWEYKARGPLTRAIMALVALDDGLALLLFGFASAVAAALTGHSDGSLATTIMTPLYEMFGAVALGVAAGLLLVGVLRFVTEEDKVLTFVIASVMVIIGLSLALHVESILATMVLGAAIANLSPRRSQATFSLVEKFAPPIFVLFFVLVGARLELRNLPLWIGVLVATYFVAFTFAKWTSSWYGAKISGAPATVRKYLGLCLFSQAGVAVGLAIIASHRFAGDFGQAVILVITASTFLVQIIGPPAVKYGLRRAGEVGLNITEEDLMKTYRVFNVMNTDYTTIPQSTRLRELLYAFSVSDTLFYPVTDKENKLVGVITIDHLKQVFAEQETADWLLAADLMAPVRDKTSPETPLEKAVEYMDRYQLDDMPVIDDADHLRGVLHRRAVDRKISAEVLRRRKSADQAQLAAAGPPA